MDVTPLAASLWERVLDAVATRDHAQVLAAACGLLAGPARVLIAVDGRSGAGKTTFSGALHEANPSVSVLHLDDLYRDWDDLACGIVRARQLVEAWARGQSPSYQPTHWPGTEARNRVVIDAGRSLVVEGVGAGWACCTYATSSIWVSAPRELRQNRALTRDGDTYAPHWLSWADSEDAWFEAHPPHPDVLIAAGQSKAAGAPCDSAALAVRDLDERCEARRFRFG